MSAPSPANSIHLPHPNADGAHSAYWRERERECERDTQPLWGSSRLASAGDHTGNDQRGSTKASFSTREKTDAGRLMLVDGLYGEMGRNEEYSRTLHLLHK